MRFFRSKKTKKKAHSHHQSRFSRYRRRLRWLYRLLLLLFVVDSFYLLQIWPDWDRIAKGYTPESRFIEAYRQRQRNDKTLPPLKWYPIAGKQIVKEMRRAVVVSEDSRFYQHRGFDLIALSEAFNYNLEVGRFAYGASTISQQVVKNLFLSASKDPLRKWHELVLTLGMEFKLRKSRIIELYLNIAEFGIGVYGVEAAARHYWQQHASQLNTQQAIELAACLPSPKKHNPYTRSGIYLKRVEKIQRNYNIRFAPKD